MAIPEQNKMNKFDKIKMQYIRQLYLLLKRSNQ